MTPIPCPGQVADVWKPSVAELILRLLPLHEGFIAIVLQMCTDVWAMK